MSWRTSNTNTNISWFFCSSLQSDRYKPLNTQSLANLIGHLSNLELKPLRKYFNDEGHQNGDYWDEARLSRFFGRWILQEWRINPSKDKLKLKGGDYDHLKLKKKWKNKPGTVIDFWLHNEPGWTIPPYQDNNNRRPPKCQSLILNPVFLDNHYPGWQDWLEELKKLSKEYLDDFEHELKNLKSGRSKPYFNNGIAGSRRTNSEHRTAKDLKARVLQFILDRVKADDPLKLNEIYSQTKKYRQQQSTEEEKRDSRACLEQVIIEESDLPDRLKSPRCYQDNAVFKQGSFLHLVCNYYKIRQRARDGRIFIHPEYRYIKGQGYTNTGRFDDKDELLTYCNYKPRQKRYQMLGDLAGLLQISADGLEQVARKEDGQTIDEKLSNWLNNIKGLQTNCDRAAKEQKERRGRLRLDIQNIFGLIYYRKSSESPSDGEIKKILKSSKVSDATKLHGFCKRAKKLCLELTNCLYDDPRQQEWQQELERNPARAIYLLAQINNIAFKERNGYAKTCAVCSLDNAYRMRRQPVENGKDGRAKAQRLPAIETRLIDGAVKRMARIVGGAIAEDKWKRIEPELQQNKKIRIPIITESNRFEFEPDLKALKGKTPTQRDKNYKGYTPFSDKEGRIKDAGRSICPYTGKSISEAEGEIDHIIPRSSERGTLNDEANLIWASKEGNKNAKGDNIFSLTNLHLNYKNGQFDGMDNGRIEMWIIKQIDNDSDEDFKFGPYRSFINLSADEQKAFRHALFLKEGHLLREKVINAIDNRTRTFVNGTQRYFAEVLANNLYKKAKSIKKQRLLSFDYFGVEAQSNTRGDGIADLRKDYERVNEVVRKYTKKGGQEPYSHLIDAQLAFAMMVDAHKDDGSLKLNTNNHALWPCDTDKTTGEEFEKPDNIFNVIRVAPKKMEQSNLKRRTVYDVETHHRKLLSDDKPEQVRVHYQIHRDSIIAERFLPLIQQDDKIKKGFHPSNSTPYQRKKFDILKPFLKRKSVVNLGYEVWVVDKTSALDFLMQVGRRGGTENERKIARLLDDLSYQTVKKSIQSILHDPRLSTETKKRIDGGELPKDEKAALHKSIKKPPETVGDALQAWNCFIYEDKFKIDGLILPVFNQWVMLKDKLTQAGEKDEGQSLQKFLESCDLFSSGQKHPHQKVRKVYSLPVVAAIGNIRLRRRTWDVHTIIQTVPEESLARYGYDGKSRPHTILSKNSIPKKHYDGLPENWTPYPREWKKIPKGDAEEPILHAEVKNKEADRCWARLTVKCIKKFSLPQDKSEWKGKVKRYDNESDLNEAKDKDQQGHYHCLESKFKWFDKPFEMIRERNDVSLKGCPEGYIVEFTIQKTKKVKDWLSGQA